MQLSKRIHSARVPLLVSAIALFFGVLYIAITPPLWGLDEIAHFNRAYEISNGQTIPKENSKGDYGNDIPKNLAALEYTVYADLMDNKFEAISARKDVTNYQIYKTLGSAHFDSKISQATPITATYPSVAYAGPVLGVTVAKAFNLEIVPTIQLARFLGLLSYVLFLFVSIYVLRNYKLKWVFVVVGLLPVTLFQASTISADTLTNAFALCILASVLRLLLDSKKGVSPNKYLVLLPLVLAAVAPLLKLNNVLFSLFIILIPSIYFGGKLRANIIKGVTIALSVLGGILWSMSVSLTKPSSQSPRPDGLAVNQAEQISFVLHHPLQFIGITIRTIINTSDNYIQTMTGYIGWNISPLPWIFIIGLIILAIVTVVYARSEIKSISPSLLPLALISLAGIASVFGILYIAFNPVGYWAVEGVQGRYFIPFLIPVLLYMYKLPLSLQDASEATVLRTTLICSSLVLMASVLVFYIATY